VIGTLLWRPHLSTLANSFVVLAMMAWLCLLYARYRSLYPVKKSWALLAPKILFTLLVLIALLDPCWREIRPMKNAQKIALLSDVSTSMDVKDDAAGSRTARARRIAERFGDELGEWVEYKDWHFDVDMRDPKAPRGEEVRGTDVGRTMVTLSQKPDLSDCMAVVMLTDGGDEVIECERVPGVPMYIAGVGTDPSTWNDLAITNAETPPEVEVKSPFKVSAEVVARTATGDFSLKTSDVNVTVEKRVGSSFQEVKSQTVDLRKGKVRVEIEVPGEEEEGGYEYRFAVKHVEGEMTTLNNERSFRVDVRKKSIYVMLYGRMLDWNYALLKRALDDDPTIKLTSVYRTKKDIFRIEGSRQDGDEVFSRGFPEDERVLNLYKCIVLGSFRATHLRPACFEALKKYVDGGGSIVFLGGRDSFGRGGYGRTAVAPLIPWQISNAEPEISAGEYPVSVPPEGAEHAMMSATADLLEKVSSPVIYSINHVGPLRSGALGLMNASVGQNISAMVALQPYGKGQTLGVATDTMWRWGRMSGDIAEACNQFWRDVIRYMSGEFEGGRFLAVKWDRKEYQPSEEAVADIRVAGRYATGEVRVTGTIEHAGKSEKLSIDPLRGEGNAWQTKTFFPERGEYVFRLDATLGDEPLDKYERTIRVGSAVNEGAELAVDHAFLEGLAGLTGGYYEPEKDADALIRRLKALVMESAGPHDSPLVEKPDILRGSLPLYVLLAMLVLAAEWILRRRMNMM
jgi:uncharacterized membrane protein